MRSTEHLRVPEEKLARAGALGAALVALPVGGLVLLSQTSTAGLTAVAGSLLVGLIALAATPLYRLGSALGDQAVVAVHMAALGLRLLLGVAIFAALARLTDAPMTHFAVGVAAGLVASIIAEMVTAARDPRFFWVTTPAPLNSSGTERQRA